MFPHVPSHSSDDLGDNLKKRIKILLAEEKQRQPIDKSGTISKWVNSESSTNTNKRVAIAAC